MSLYIGHDQCYTVLENILRAYEASGYTRLVQYEQGGSILMDSKPAPGYVPGVLGKKETGIEYIPNADGTRIHIYYIAKERADARAIQEAARANRSGFDQREILGTIVSIKRNTNGSIQLQFVAGNRDVCDKQGHILGDKLAIRSVSVTADGAENSGLIIAMGFDQSLGIPYHQLRELAQSDEMVNRTPAQIATSLAAHARGILNTQPAQTPAVQPARPVRNQGV